MRGIAGVDRRGACTCRRPSLSLPGREQPGPVGLFVIQALRNGYGGGRCVFRDQRVRAGAARCDRNFERRPFRDRAAFPAFPGARSRRSAIFAAVYYRFGFSVVSEGLVLRRSTSSPTWLMLRADIDVVMWSMKAELAAHAADHPLRLAVPALWACGGDRDRRGAVRARLRRSVHASRSAMTPILRRCSLSRSASSLHFKGRGDRPQKLTPAAVMLARSLGSVVLLRLLRSSSRHGHLDLAGAMPVGSDAW